ncbi:hypothetical protein SPRG_10588 [Saprolegnia parasitica CBS 223.65]|uniref:VWFA domain-containing protein n=1 Tax=Saprolegnia parasitica (strain CBS 223.65) TaxID=695850 RepID=A0A067C4W1_SAPPC|nr:hypothetical protein SPRG_10588 [Saprolegnia parasitica CBS 223.65]KDO24160.1 hypothetical protein SPRG_10588 [Saprolegnia parasitica CBS 223.65]|eukprot:XP_012205104.1 hypothetical protein SPRG_10588 [Saprolegnia parasitica CBS 223.65]
MSHQEASNNKKESVATSYEGLKCYHLLKTEVRLDDGSVTFQPTLIESELFRILRALKVVDATATTTQERQLGLFVNACCNQKASTKGIDVIGCFGKQAAVAADLRAQDWWSSSLEKYLQPDDEGVYAILVPEESERPKLVLFTWLLDSSFAQQHLREQATYALRFMTTLTPTVRWCLEEADWPALETADAETRKETKRTKHAVKFIINKATVEDEKVSCDLVSVATTTKDAKLACATGATAVTMRTSEDRDVRKDAKSVEVSSSAEFVKWLMSVVSKNRFELKAQLPYDWKHAVLAHMGALPAELSCLTIEALEADLRTEAKKKARAQLEDIEACIAAAAATLFYLNEATTEADEVAAQKILETKWEALQYILDDMIALPESLASSVSTVIQLGYDELCKHDPDLAKQTTKTSLFSWSKTGHLKFPYLKAKDKALMDVILPRIRGDLKSRYDEWCNSVSTYLWSELVTNPVTRQCYNALASKKDLRAVLRAKQEELVHNAFLEALGATNEEKGPAALVTTLKATSTGYFGNSSRLNYTEERVAGAAMLLELTPIGSAPLAAIKLPRDANVIYAVLVTRVAIVVFTSGGKTHVHAYQLNGALSATALVKKEFSRLAQRCDFDVSHRHLALQHSESIVVMYAFSESFKLLEPVHHYDLKCLSPSEPYASMSLFGGANHGILCVGSNHSAQSYFLRTQQLSKRVPRFMATPDTKLVMLHNGAFMVRLVPLDGQGLRLETLEAQSHEPLPDAEIALPVALNWSTTEARAYGDKVVLLDTTTGTMVTLQVTVVTGKPASASDTHMLSALYHVFEKFPVRPKLAETGNNTGLLPTALQVHVQSSTPERREIVVNLLKAIMEKLGALQKNLSLLSLANDAVFDVDAASLKWPTMDIGHWLLALIGFVPVPICLARDNKLVLLRDGNAVCFDECVQVHDVAQQISLGAVSYILKASTLPVVVVTSMGKQSTGKSYFLNHLTGSSFASAGGRCTNGVWLTLCRSSTGLVVVLDFEGLGSMERSAQEDTLLSILNAAISHLTVFRIEMRFDKDIDCMLDKFQQGVAMLKGDDRLFRGQLYLNAKDVNPADEDGVIAEFQSKLQRLLQDNTAENFVTVMYGGAVLITACAPINNRGYYDGLADAATCLAEAWDNKAYTNGADCHEVLAIVLAKVARRDWRSMDENVQAAKVARGRQQVRHALRYGQLDEDNSTTSLGPDDDATMMSQRQSVNMTELETAAVPRDATIVLNVDFDGKIDASVNLETAKTALSTLLQQYMDHIDEPRRVAHEARFDKLWEYMVWRRIHRVRAWLMSIEEVHRDVIDELDACANKMSQLLRRCDHTCAECKLTCSASFLHKDKHDCGSDHRCKGFCAHCHRDAALLCGAVAGHPGACNCEQKNHTCQLVCKHAEARNCDGVCHLAVEHEGAHVCSVEPHFCPSQCSAPSCAHLCRLSFTDPHEKHSCGTSRCQQPCTYAGCGNMCASVDHFHAANAFHSCGHDHWCRAICTEKGMCEVKVQLEETTKMFKNQLNEFKYTHQAMNGSRKKCSVRFDAGRLDHAGDHRCDTLVHTCAERCPCCGYYCEKEYGHSGKHKASHGNMQETTFVSDLTSVNVDGRLYTAGDRGAAEMCSFFCTKMGRGHVHYVPCDHASTAACTHAASDGRRHCAATLESEPNQPMDEVLHATYWEMSGWEDPVMSALERRQFSLCPYQCEAPSHKDAKQSPSYCTLGAWHDPVTDVSSLLSGQSLVQGHVFDCQHFATSGLHHHVFVLDASGSMEGSDWDALTAAFSAYVAQLSATRNCADIISVITFSCEGTIVYEGKPLAQTTTIPIPFQGYTTSYDEGLRCALEVLSRNDHALYTPVMLFFSDGHPNENANGVALAQRIASDFAKYQLQSSCVGFGHSNFTALRTLATHLQGTYTTAVSDTDLLTTFKDISVGVHLKTGLIAKTPRALVPLAP